MPEAKKQQTTIGPFTFTDDTPGRVTIQRGNETVNVVLASVPLAALSALSRAHYHPCGLARRTNPPALSEAIAAMQEFWAEHWP
jgi:hypothetical protein